MKQTIKALGINFMMLLVVLLCATGCSSESKLKAAVEGANKDCPQAIEGVGTIKSFTFENGDVYCNCTVNGYIDIDLLKSLSDEIKPGIIEAMVSEARSNADSKELLDLVVDANASIIYRFSDNYGESVEYVITPSEIKKAM